MSELLFHLEKFDGPLDLLLHLISKNKVNIYDIPIALITTQYMEYLDEMKKADLEIQSEFLLMAAKLLYIKSRVILPQYDEDDEEDDPRQELILSLAEYKKYKDISLFFDDRKSICDYICFKTPNNLDEFKTEQKLGTIPLDKLSMAFATVMERFEKTLPPSKMLFSGIVGREPVSVKSKVKDIKYRLHVEGQIEFNNLFDDVKSRSEIVAIFLAVLEMVRNDSLTLSYTGNQILLNNSQGEYNEHSTD